MSALSNFIKKITGTAAKEDASRLKVLLKSITEKEGAHGDPFLELGGGKVLRRTGFNPAASHRYEEEWRPFDKGQPGDSGLGVFKTSASDVGPADMDEAYLDVGARGQGLGKSAYRKLADHYGGLWSSPLVTSDEARGVYKALGAESRDRLYIEGRPQTPRWGIFE